MSVTRLSIAVVLFALVSTMSGCKTVPAPDPVPDKPMHPLTVYWPSVTLEPDSEQKSQ
jgi:hypothetical protein